MIGRRALLRGGLAILGGTALLGGSGLVLAGCGGLPDGVPHVGRGPRISGSFVSRRRRGVRTGWTVAYPPGAAAGDELPVIVVLHGRGGDHTSAFDGDLHLDYFLADAVTRGARPFALASVDGGDHGYWHPRRDGDTAGMVIEEFLPLLASHSLRVDRIGLFGWSMGGYGALYLTTRHPSKVSVCVVESPAIWQHSWQSAAGAFDDAADFDAHAIFPHVAALQGLPLRVDCGASDGFAPVTRDLRASIHPAPTGGIEPGGHDDGYWRSQAAAQLRFAGRHVGT